MKRKVIETEDGSSTILVEAWGESFHSIHGAIKKRNSFISKTGCVLFFEEKLNKFMFLKLVSVPD